MSAPLPVGPALIRIASLVEDRYEEIGAELGVSFREGRLLVAVSRAPRTVGTLRAYVRVRKSTMTGVLARMVDGGLVVRVPDPNDGRATLIEPTARGREIADALLTRVQAAIAGLLEPLDAASREELARLLSLMLFRADEVDEVVIPSE